MMHLLLHLQQHLLLRLRGGGLREKAPNLDEEDVGVEGRARPAMVVGMMGGTELPGSDKTST